MEKNMAKKKIDLREVVEDARNYEEVSSSKFDLIPRELNFEIRFDAPDGKSYNEKLISKIMDGDDRLTQQRVIQKLCSGVLFDNLSYAEKLRIDAISRALTQIKDVPDFIAHWIGEDDQLLAEINEILVEHETRYFRGNARKSPDGSAEKRVSITCSAFSEDDSP